MKLLIKQARVVDPLSPFNGQTIDIYIENGTLAQLGKNLKANADTVISEEGLHVSPGWVDLFADFGDPGYEFKETLQSGAAAAAAGGYTDVLLLPNTKPVVHNKSAVEYIKRKTESLPVDLHPIGAITNNTEGKELAEMYDMRASGAIAFSDGIHCVQSPGLLVKALQYVKAFDGTIIQLPDDKSINPQGLMNEGIVSTQLGLPGKPTVSEELVIDRDIKLARYAESKIHFTGVSTAKSLEYIQRARESAVAVSCSVTPYHLYFSDEDLRDYDSNLKVNPPLRTTKDRDQLRKAILDGTVDCLASHHLPHEYDSKVLEFEYARPGMIGMETAFAVLMSAMPGLPVERAVQLLAENPRKLFGLDTATIADKKPGCLTLFNPATKWIYNTDKIRSKSRNSPFIGRELYGKVIGIVNKGQLILN